MYKEYKVGDLVHFDNTEILGVGKVVGFSGNDILVHSPSIDGHNGNEFVETQNNNNNYFFVTSELSPFTKKVGQRYTFIGDDNEFKDGEIITLVEIDDDTCSVYSNGINANYLYDVDNNEYEPEVQYLDEGEQGFTQQDLEVGMFIANHTGNPVKMLNGEQVEMYRKNCFVDSIYKLNENGDLIKIWERSNEELFTLEGSFTKEETIKIGEHLDWKKVK